MNIARDYGLTGDDAKALHRGLAGRWYATAVPRPVIKALMQRRDGPAIRDTLLWLGGLVTSGWLGVHFWGSLLAIPCFLVYGVLYGSSGDSRWHECGHGTAFKSRWLNAIIYQLACFMILREPTVWRWSHIRHHTDTLIVGRDPEIAVPLPPSLIDLGLNVFALEEHRRLAAEAVPACRRRSHGRRAHFHSHLGVLENPVGRTRMDPDFAAVVFACIRTHSVLPAMLVGLPTIYGGFMLLFFGLTQHAGLAEDVLDHLTQQSHRIHESTVPLSLPQYELSP